MRNRVYNFQVPRVFKLSQKYLGIEEEWAILRSNLWKHKFKLVLLTSIATYPLYQSHIQVARSYLRARLNNELESQLSKEKPLTQISQSFLKTVVVDTLKTEPLKRGGIDYVVDLIKEKAIIDGVVDLLITSLKDEKFLSQVKVEGKKLGLGLIKDKEVEKDAVAMFIDLLRDPEIKYETSALVKDMFQQPEIKEALVQLFLKAFDDDDLQAGMKAMLEGCFHKILLEQETADKFTVFMYNLANSETKGQGGSLMNLLFAKMTKSFSKNSSSPIEMIINDQQSLENKKLQEKKDRQIKEYQEMLKKYQPQSLSNDSIREYEAKEQELMKRNEELENELQRVQLSRRQELELKSASLGDISLLGDNKSDEFTMSQNKEQGQNQSLVIDTQALDGSKIDTSIVNKNETVIDEIKSDPAAAQEKETELLEKEKEAVKDEKRSENNPEQQTNQEETQKLAMQLDFSQIIKEEIDQNSQKQALPVQANSNEMQGADPTQIDLINNQGTRTSNPIEQLDHQDNKKQPNLDK